MGIDARAIEEKDFTVSTFRGYKMNEVDDFLDDVAEEVARLQKANLELEEKLAQSLEKEKHAAELEQTLRDTLITAQRAAEDVVRASREKAAAMIKDSELEGKRIIEEAEAQAQAAVQRLDAINRDVAGVKAVMRKIISEQLRLLDESYPDPAPAAGNRDCRQVAAEPVPADFDRTQEFNTREIREQMEDEQEYPKINFNDQLPRIGLNEEIEA